mgnify:CR=1 FL=1
MDKRSYNKRQVGTEKEKLAAEYLKKKGYFIIEKNYRVRQGEIDLIGTACVSCSSRSNTGRMAEAGMP